MRRVYITRRRSWGVAAALGIAALLIVQPAAVPAAPTVVSLTFDDGRQSQYQTREPLRQRGMRGTFFVNGNGVGTSTSSWNMTLTQLRALAADGHEIGGHTLDHARLTSLSYDQQVRQVCDDRTLLLQRGFSPVVSFAYPYGAYNSSVQAVVRSCGYTSGRRVGGIRDVFCSTCPTAESLPPADAFATRTPVDIRSTTTLSQMQQYVTQAENSGGGWVQLVFHDVCVACDPEGYWVSPSQFAAFLDWLRPRSAGGTVVRTVAEALGGGTPEPSPEPTPDAGTVARLDEPFTGTLNTSRWYAESGVTQSDGRLHIQATSSWPGVWSEVLWDMTEARTSVELPGVPATASPAIHLMAAGNYANRITVHKSGSTLYVREYVDNVSQSAASFSTAYSTTQHRFLAIRTAGSTTSLQASTDGTSWITLKTWTRRTALGSAGIGINAGGSGTVDVDNLRIVPSQ